MSYHLDQKIHTSNGAAHIRSVIQYTMQYTIVMDSKLDGSEISIKILVVVLSI